MGRKNLSMVSLPPPMICLNIGPWFGGFGWHMQAHTVASCHQFMNMTGDIWILNSKPATGSPIKSRASCIAPWTVPISYSKMQRETTTTGIHHFGKQMGLMLTNIWDIFEVDQMSPEEFQKGFKGVIVVNGLRGLPGEDIE
jgi:hypothetical protein